MTTTVYTTYVEGTTAYTGPDLEVAIRAWDQATFGLGRSVPGGISVQGFDEDEVMVRDGWILHIADNGTCFLNTQVAR